MQVTAQSLLGRFGKTAKGCAHELMGRGLVHFLASDAHDTKWRTTALDEARQYVERAFRPRSGVAPVRGKSALGAGRGAAKSGAAASTRKPWYDSGRNRPPGLSQASKARPFHQSGFH